MAEPTTLEVFTDHVTLVLFSTGRIEKLKEKYNIEMKWCTFCCIPRHRGKAAR